MRFIFSSASYAAENERRNVPLMVGYILLSSSFPSPVGLCAREVPCMSFQRQLSPSLLSLARSLTEETKKDPNAAFCYYNLSWLASSSSSVKVQALFFLYMA